MQVTKYTYSILEDFPNNKIAPAVLKDEIDANSEISITVDYIDTNDNVCDIYMSDILTGAEEDQLGTVVDAHQGDDYDILFNGYAESLTLNSTTNTEYQQKLRLTSRLQSNNYYIEWSAEVMSSYLNVLVKLRIQIDDTIDICELGWSTDINANGYVPVSGFLRLYIDAGIHNIDLDFCTSRANKSVNIKRVSIRINRGD